MIYRTHNVVFTASVLVIAALFLAGSYVIVSEYDLLFTDNAQGITNFKKLEKRLAGIRDRKIQNELVYRYGESVRDVVREENEMIDQRMMRMLTLNGLLFTTLGFAWGTSKVLNRLPLILSGLGAVSSFSFGFILQTGLKSIESTYDLWCILSKYSEYPPPILGMSKEGIVPESTFLLSWNFLPFLLYTAWVLVAFAVAVERWERARSISAAKGCRRAGDSSCPD